MSEIETLHEKVDQGIYSTQYWYHTKEGAQETSYISNILSPKNATVKDNIHVQYTHVAYPSVEDAVHYWLLLACQKDAKGAHRIIFIDTDWPLSCYHFLTILVVI